MQRNLIMHEVSSIRALVFSVYYVFLHHHWTTTRLSWRARCLSGIWMEHVGLAGIS